MSADDFLDEPAAFFVPDGDRFAATVLTRGPWSRDLMHGGPPAALLARAIERLAGPDMPVVRVTVEFLRPLAIGSFALSAAVSRPGKKVQGFAASLEAGGKEIVRASALAIRRAPLALPPLPAPAAAFPTPDASAPYRFTFFTESVGYHTAMEMRVARGEFGRGAMAAWMRTRVPIVAGEAPSPLERVMVAADSGNGVSLLLDTRRYSFVNPDLTVVLHRPLEGEWVCLDATTTPGPAGAGLAESALHDTRGPVGRALQTLIIEAREPR